MINFVRRCLGLAQDILRAYSHQAETKSKWLRNDFLVTCTVLFKMKQEQHYKLCSTNCAFRQLNRFPIYQGYAAWLTAEEESDRISMKKTNYIKSILLSFLKVCLYGCYTNCQFYQISLFRQVNIVFRKISENHFFKDCILNFT